MCAYFKGVKQLHTQKETKFNSLILNQELNLEAELFSTHFAAFLFPNEVLDGIKTLKS